MISLSKIILLAVVAQYIDGNQGIVHVHVSQFNSSDTNNSTTRDDSDCHFTCCIYGNCPCNSLKCALGNLNHNVQINITTNITFSMPLLIVVSNLKNISITGYNNPTVFCKKGGHIRFTSCHNCIIQGITWDGCGTNDGKPGLEMKYSSNITIQNCSFQHSTDRAVVLSDVSGDVSINHCNFMHNSVFKSHGAVIYHSLSNNVGIFFPFILTLRITHCNLSLNKGVESIVILTIKALHMLVTLSSLVQHFMIIKVYLFMW